MLIKKIADKLFINKLTIFVTRSKITIMIDTLIIKNFKSLKNVRFDLQKINLFIGPNNSGKTNVFKALEYLFHSILSDKTKIAIENLRRDYFSFGNKETTVFNEPISFIFCKKKEKSYNYYIVEFWGLNKNNQIIKREFIGETTQELPDDFSIGNWKESENLISTFTVQLFYSRGINFDSIHYNRLNNYSLILFRDKTATIVQTQSDTKGVNNLFDFENIDIEIAKFLRSISQNIRIYTPDPNQIKKPGLLGTDDFVNSDASNLVSFFDNMRDYQPEIFAEIKKDLTECLPEIKDIRFKKIKINNKISKQVVLFDVYNRGFLSDEVSEGILYFMALLAIVHQPSPPKLLMIEEPEKGIHPRRLHEIMHFIFELADKKDIQIMLTSHSPQVVNEFENFPETIFVFDNEKGETKVKNLLKDIIEPSDKKSDEKGFPKIDYTQTLGEHWIYGFLGGVPK